MKKFTLFSIIALSFSAPLYTLKIQEVIYDEAKTTATTIKENLEINAYTLTIEAAKCREKQSAETIPCLQQVQQKVQTEKTKNWYALRDIFIADIAIETVAAMIGALSTGNTGNGLSRAVSKSTIPLGFAAFVIVPDQIGLYWLGDEIDKHLKNKPSF